MKTPDAISSELKQALRRLKLSPMVETLPERLALARQRKMPHQDFLLTVIIDEVERRDRLSARNRAQRARLDAQMVLEAWDATAKVTFDRELWSELSTLRFLDSHYHVLILGPVGVGKTFLANALGHVACRQGHSVAMLRAEELFKRLRGARLDQTHEQELRRFIRVDLLIIDDFALDPMDAAASHDFYELVVERHRAGSLVVTSNRDPQEWLAMMPEPLRAQSAIDRLQNAAYELVIEGESYRKRQKPRKRGTK